MQKEPKTYVATIRVRIQDMASLAMFYNSKGFQLETLSKLASEVVMNSAALMKESFPVESVTKAVEILTNLKYDVLKKNAKNHRTLMNQLSLESISTVRQTKINETAEQLAKEFKSEAEAKPKLKVILTTDDLADIDRKSEKELKTMRSEMTAPVEGD